MASNAATATAAATKAITLSTPESWHSWYKTIKSGVQEDLWDYFDPDSDTDYTIPHQPSPADVRRGVTTVAGLNELQLAAYKQMRDDFKLDEARYLRYIKEKARVRTLEIVPHLLVRR